MHSILITDTKLNELRHLADWQLRAQGYDPDSVTAAWQAYEASCRRTRDAAAVPAEWATSATPGDAK